MDLPGEFWQELLAEYREKAKTELADDADVDVAVAMAEGEARLEWLRRRWGEHYPCPNCGNTEWYVNDAAHLGSVIAAYPISCRYCGNTFLVDPNRADLDEPRKTLPDDE